VSLEALWTASGGDPQETAMVRFSGPRHVLPSNFDVTEAAAVSVAAASLAAARFTSERNATPLRTLEIDRRHAAIAFRSERHLRVDGRRPAAFDPVSGDYATADGRWIRLHASFPAHRDVACRVLGTVPERGAVAAAVCSWSGDALEDAVHAAGGCAAVMRSTEAWRALPQGQALDGLPAVEWDVIGPAAPERARPGERPLEGIRVLDLTRVIAGPVCGRFLAACGADVLRIKSPHLPDIEALAIDTGLGKRTATLDLRNPTDRAAFVRLVAEADVVVQSYRPGALDALGLSAERLSSLRPGLVTAELSAYGRLGPWSMRRGFDSLVQMASGIAHAGALAHGGDRPIPLPAQALDHASGYLLAFGIVRALSQRAADGGSRRVRVSLARTGRWIEDLGRIDALDVPDPGHDDVADLLATTVTAHGAVTHVRLLGV
jgi:hypothetical protein